MIAELLIEALLIVSVISGIPLMAALVVGLSISVLQAATQVSEQTLTFVPKLVVIVLVLFLCWPWSASLIDEYVTKLYMLIPEISQGRII